MQTLNNIIVVVLNTSLWSGRKKLRAEDLAANGIEVDKLPPGTLASLGTKRIIAPEALNPFIALKKEAERICLAKGIRFLGGYAIPKEGIDSLAEDLKDIKRRFIEAKDTLLSNYDKEINKWISENPPEWAAVIRAAVEPASTIDAAMHFNFAPIAVGSPEGMEDKNEGLDEEANGMLAQLYHEIRLHAKTAYEASLVGKKEVTRKALRPAAAIRDKLQGLAFLDPEIAVTIQAINEVLEILVKVSPITGSNLDMLAGLLGRRLANIGRPYTEDETEEAVEEIQDGNIEEFIAEIIPQQQTAPAPLTYDF
ncbi:DUF3150 domain-containing protein [Pelobacter propionicus]|uniref:DUF3150 domain-containing protein n=1 Tax=Pelobacter propionicus (strain DSM 2379 / NBRC 103807 / OttBd1) TaxID=338966 RepID=A0R7W5_PELPD|nr:DUF3150 domain-containing protein [Pelobacter propionicus]ABL01322.1 conserved hypothetical protein [Pelobacter propionicus DSM 2379]